MKKKQKIEAVSWDESLNEKQHNAVKDAIVEAMRDIFIDTGVTPEQGFEVSAMGLADKILKIAHIKLVKKVEKPKGKLLPRNFDKFKKK